MTAAVHNGLFFDTPAEPRLRASRCGSCGRHQFPAQPSCCYCGSADGTIVALGRCGRVVLCTSIVNRPPGYGGPLPFAFGVVELPEGIRVVSRLLGPSTVAPGTAVDLVTEVVGCDSDGRELVTYAFAPVSGGGDWNGAEAAAVAPSAVLPSIDVPWGRPVYLEGVGIHPFGRFADRALTGLGVVAVRDALAAAGCARGGFQAAYCASVYGGVGAGHKVLAALGLSGVPIVNVEAGCASGGAAMSLAADAIASGRYERVLVLGLEKMPRGIIRSSFFEPWQEQSGLAVTPAYFALRALRLMRDSGVTIEQLADVSVKNHRHGVGNPNAMYRTELTRQQVLDSAVVCDPLRLLMLCAPNEGAAAVVLSATPSRVRLLAATLRSHLTGNVLGEHTPLSGSCDPDPPSPTELAATAAYEMAGIDPRTVDVVELQDTDSARELLSYEELGLCGRGDCARWFGEGHTRLGGSQPVNPSGGLLSKGEPLGASGLAQVVEIYHQLRGEAEGRQVAGARLGLAHTVGRGANASVVVLARS